MPSERRAVTTVRVRTPGTTVTWGTRADLDDLERQVRLLAISWGG